MKLQHSATSQNTPLRNDIVHWEPSVIRNSAIHRRQKCRQRGGACSAPPPSRARRWHAPLRMQISGVWCRGGKSNPHALRRRCLRPLRLPIPSPRRGMSLHDNTFCVRRALSDKLGCPTISSGLLLGEAPSQARQRTPLIHFGTKKGAHDSNRGFGYNQSQSHGVVTGLSIRL